MQVAGTVKVGRNFKADSLRINTNRLASTYRRESLAKESAAEKVEEIME